MSWDIKPLSVLIWDSINSKNEKKRIEKKRKTAGHYWFASQKNLRWSLPVNHWVYGFAEISLEGKILVKSLAEDSKMTNFIDSFFVNVNSRQRDSLLSFGTELTCTLHCCKCEDLHCGVFLDTRETINYKLALRESWEVVVSCSWLPVLKINRGCLRVSIVLKQDSLLKNLHIDPVILEFVFKVFMESRQWTETAV